MYKMKLLIAIFIVAPFALCAQVKPIAELSAGNECCISLAQYSHNQKYILTTSGDAVKVFDAGTFKQLTSLHIKLNGYKDYDKGVKSAFFSPDDTYIITAVNGWTIQLWDAVSGRPVDTWLDKYGAELEKDDIKVYSASYSPDGKYIVIAGSAGYTIHNAKDGSVHMQQKADCLSFSNDSKYIVTIYKQNHGSMVKILDASDGSTVKSAEIPGANWAFFSPDGVFVAVLTPGEVQVLDAASLTVVKSVKASNTTTMYNFAGAPLFSPDSRYLFYIFNGCMALDIKKSEVIPSAEIQPSDTYSYSFSPDGKYLVTTGTSNTSGKYKITAQVWNWSSFVN